MHAYTNTLSLSFSFSHCQQMSVLQSICHRACLNPLYWAHLNFSMKRGANDYFIKTKVNLPTFSAFLWSASCRWTLQQPPFPTPCWYWSCAQDRHAPVKSSSDGKCRPISCPLAQTAGHSIWNTKKRKMRSDQSWAHPGIGHRWACIYQCEQNKKLVQTK